MLLLRKAKFFAEFLALHYAVLLGITSLRLDYEQRRVIECRFATAYACFINIAMIISMPFMIYLSDPVFGSVMQHVLVRLTYSGTSLVQLIVVVLMVFSRQQREQRLKTIAYKIFALDTRFFNKLPEQLARSEEPYFDSLLLGKFVGTFAPAANVIYASLVASSKASASTASNSDSLMLALFIVFFANLENLCNIIAFQYYYGLWQVYRRFRLLNMQLAQICENLLRAQTDWQRLRLASELKEIAGIHWKLTQLTLKINECFEYQMLGILLVQLLNDISHAYYIWVVTDGSLNIAATWYSVCLSVLAYLSVLASNMMLFWMCHNITQAHQYTAIVLKEINVVPGLLTTLERQCNAFAVQLVQFKLKIKLSGMVELNKNALLAMWGYIVQHLLILVQFDYEFRAKRSITSNKILFDPK